MKKKVLILLILLVLPLVIACEDDQRILRISADTNAHAEVYNGIGNYAVEICYDEIFGEEYDGENPHDCVVNNKIISLSAETNAHASITHTTNYNVDICYGDLICESGTECSEGYTHILSLSSGSNAHLELPGEGNYNAFICCKLAGPVCGDGICEEGEDYQNCVQDCAGQISVKWTDTSGNTINSAALGFPVRLNITGENLENAKINYTIYKQGSFHKSYLEVDKTYQDWNAGEKHSGELEEGTYQFSAVVNNDGREKTAGDLLIHDTETTCDDFSCEHDECDDEGCEGEYCKDSNSACICMDHPDYPNKHCYSLTEFDTCGDYKTEPSCEKDKASVGDCEWLSGKCVEKIYISDDQGHEFMCIKDYKKEPYGEGRIKIIWTAVAEWIKGKPSDPDEEKRVLEEQDCVAGERIVKYNILKLPFFSFLSLVFSISLIIIIYLIKKELL